MFDPSEIRSTADYIGSYTQRNTKEKVLACVQNNFTTYVVQTWTWKTTSHLKTSNTRNIRDTLGLHKRSLSRFKLLHCNMLIKDTSTLSL